MPCGCRQTRARWSGRVLRISSQARHLLRLSITDSASSSRRGTGDSIMPIYCSPCALVCFPPEYGSGAIRKMKRSDRPGAHFDSSLAGTVRSRLFICRAGWEPKRTELIGLTLASRYQPEYDGPALSPDAGFPPRLVTSALLSARTISSHPHTCMPANRWPRWALWDAVVTMPSISSARDCTLNRSGHHCVPLCRRGYKGPRQQIPRRWGGEGARNQRPITFPSRRASMTKHLRW